MQGFTGDRVAQALEAEGVDVMVIYGPEYDLWLDGIDPELQAAMARAYNRWGQEMRETSGGRGHHVGAGPAQRRRPRGRGDPVRVRRARHPLLLGPTQPVQPPQPRRPLLRPDLRAAPGPRLRVRDARVHGPQRADARALTASHVHRVAHGRAPPRSAERDAVDDRARRVRALPAPALRLHGGRLRLAAVVAAPHRRAPRAGGREGVPRPDDDGDRVLPAQLLDLDRVRGPRSSPT